MLLDSEIQTALENFGKNFFKNSGYQGIRTEQSEHRTVKFLKMTARK